MADFRQDYRELLNRSKSALEDELRELLPTNYQDRLTGNANAGLLEGAFKRIDPGEDPYTLVKTWHNYDPSWNKGKSVATALRMVLTEQIGLPRYEVISGYTKPTLSKMVLGIKASDDGVSRGEELHDPLTLPPDIEPPFPDPPELTGQSVESRDEIIKLTDMDTIISTYDNPSGKFAVYVLDCTPESSRERKAMWDFRRDTFAKSKAGYKLNEREQYAQALNKGERLYYVGQTKNITKRLKAHRDGAASGGGYFTNFFKPRGVFDVSWFDSVNEARDGEVTRSSELTNPGVSRAYYS